MHHRLPAGMLKESAPTRPSAMRHPSKLRRIATFHPGDPAVPNDEGPGRPEAFDVQA
jgi:hypothetical protein